MHPGPPKKQGNVLRNTLLLVGAQALGTPLSILLNAVMGRHLGASDFGYVYLAGTFVGFGFLFVDWGHSNILPAAVAQDRSRAGVLLGSSIVWRILSAIVVTIVLCLSCWLLDYPRTFRLVLAVVALQTLFIAVAAGFQDVVRGFERTDVDALGRFALPLLMTLFVLPTLLLGGKLLPVVLAQAAASGALLLLVWRAARRVSVLRMSFDINEFKALARKGQTFLVMGVGLAMQGTVDGAALSKLSTPEVMGWHAAAQRLTGILLVPSSALIASLYPTLSRLFVEDMAQYRETTRRAIDGTATLAIPLALCCAFYREVGVSLYSRKVYGPAEQNLLVLSLMLLLLYFSMPLGSAILAAGRQRTWAWAQVACVVVRLVLDPPLIPWFQKHYGNGGVAVCVASVVSEILVVTVALFTIPEGVLDRNLARGLGKAAVAGAAFASVAFALGRITPYVAAPIAVLAYIAALWLVGGVDKEQLSKFVGAVNRKLSRRRA